jgi:hypothetical protein
MIVPGECEVFPPGECQDFPTDECVNDQQCQDIYLDLPGLKCCMNYCGLRVCDLPVNVQADLTQAPPYSEYLCPVEAGEQYECPLEEDQDYEKECAKDNECDTLYPGKGFKCCNDGCGSTYCEKTVRRKNPQGTQTEHESAVE